MHGCVRVCDQRCPVCCQLLQCKVTIYPGLVDVVKEVLAERQGSLALAFVSALASEKRRRNREE